jgi:hypothetical protein
VPEMDQKFSNLEIITRLSRLAFAAERGQLEGLECPNCNQPKVSVWFTHPAPDEYRTWFFALNVIFIPAHTTLTCRLSLRKIAVAMSWKSETERFWNRRFLGDRRAENLAEGEPNHVTPRITLQGCSSSSNIYAGIFRHSRAGVPRHSGQ